MKARKSLCVFLLALLALTSTSVYAAQNSDGATQYQGHIGFTYTDLQGNDGTKYATKVTENSYKGYVQSNFSSFAYWFRLVNSNNEERAYAFVDTQNKVNFSNSQTQKGYYYYPEARREHPFQSGDVSGYFKP